MDWLNFHHLRYFWMVAREGGLRQAAEKLHVSPPSISAQIGELEDALGEKLFRRSGRANVLTEAGQIALRYADDIFGLGRELAGAVKQRPTASALRLHVGVADSFSKLVTQQILQPVFAMPQSVHVICREGKVSDLLGQLAAHRLDIVLADEPTSALDVSVQAQVLDLFRETREAMGLTSIFVSHNLAVIRQVSDTVAVMRLGRIVEMGRVDDIFANPQHDYTRALIDAVPDHAAIMARP